ncbi:MAG: hypothetical protein V4581_14425 [Bacteroidota bacterium]
MPKQLPAVILSDEQLEAVADLAATNYSPEKIALYLQVDKAGFMQQWFDRCSLIREAYDGGQLKAEFEINQKQLELARAGNITAAQIFLKESAAIKIENLKKQCLFGE